MIHLLWDASALAKRYIPEAGSDSVDALFTFTPRPQHIGTVIGFAETYAILLRKRNQGLVDEITFRNAKTYLRAEVASNLEFLLQTITDIDIFTSLAFIERHNINATDAAILTVFLEYKRALLPDASCLLVSADQRLLAAAGREGMATLNPERVSIEDIPRILATA